MLHSKQLNYALHQKLDHWTAALLRNTGRYIVPPCYKCDKHGPMCTGCRSTKGGCLICRGTPTRDKKADMLLDTHIALVCVNEPDCDLAFPSFWYVEHWLECPLNQNDDDIPIAPVIYVPLELNQNPALVLPRQLQYERDLQIAAKKRERRRRHRQRRKAGTTIQPSNIYKTKVLKVHILFITEYCK